MGGHGATVSEPPRRRQPGAPAYASGVRGVFVTGTDTGAGKTVVAAAIAASLHRGSGTVAAFKPVVTGLDDPADPDWPPDHELLARVTGAESRDVAPHTFGPAVSPHLAAARAGRPLEPRALAASARALGARVDALVVEGVGGLLVPLTPDYSVRDLAADLGLPLVVAARPGLGTINHTRLTVEAARAAGLAVAAVVMTPWPPEPSALQESNRTTVQALADVPVFTMATLARADPEALADAAARWPVEQWLGP
jgi:dethiobiotin synthetase